MPTTICPRLNGLQRFFFIVLCVWCVAAVLWSNGTLTILQKHNKVHDLPFGVFTLPKGVSTIDFSYNLIFLKGIQERLVQRPYVLQEQEKLVRQVLPQSTSGMSHAYSPVALVLVSPLLLVSGQQAYVLYTVLCAIGILLLFYFYLLPRAEDPIQVYALAVCAISVCLMAAFAVAQSALLTTTLLGAFWWAVQRRTALSSLGNDFLIAVLFWALCLKPSVALIPFMLLLGAQAWRAAAISLGLLIVTWTCLSGYYGGWWTGIWDYLNLLNHYNNAEFTPFMQRWPQTADDKFRTLLLFDLNRAVLLNSSVALLLLRWSHRITASEHFQGMVWLFLLFSPYLLVSEEWVFCLLVVEGSFFHTGNKLSSFGKLFLLAGILDLRSGLFVPMHIHVLLKYLLLLWIVIEWIQARRSSSPAIMA